MVSSIGTTTFIADSIIYIRDDLKNNITDPISGKRDSKEQFVMTSYPKRSVKYPIITIRSDGTNFYAKGGMQSEVSHYILRIEIRIWARNEVERDELTQEVLDRLRDIQHTATTGSIAVGLHDLRVVGWADIDDEKGGDEVIKSRVLIVSYRVIVGQ